MLRPATSSFFMVFVFLALACSSGPSGGAGAGGSARAGAPGAGGASGVVSDATGGAGGLPGTGVGLGGRSGGVGGGSTATGGKVGSGGAGGGLGSGGSVAGGASGIGGRTGTGGGAAGVSGSVGAGGQVGGGGASSVGGAGGSGGSGSGGSTSGSGNCDPGSTATAWASDCIAAAPTTCTEGTWTAGGPQNDSCCSAMTLRSESEHFAVYSDESSVTSSTAQAAVNHLETVWKTYFGSPMYMREPFCTSAKKTKANIHVHSDWGLTGGSFDGRMGMWIGTAGLSDHWALAHEFMHGVQSVQGGQVCNQSNTCGWVYESHANWAPQQLSEYHTTSLHCSELFVNAPHLYLGNTRDRYCNWQFLEYLKDKHCFGAVNAIWTGKPAADPFTAIMNGLGWNVAQLNEFMGEWAMHNITWDYQDPEPQSTAGKNQGAFYRKTYGQITDTSKNDRKLRLAKVEPLDSEYPSNRRFASPSYWAPQRYGYNIVRLHPDSGATSVTVTFRGVTSAPASPDWRWGLVATDAGLTTARYSALQKGADAELTFCVSPGESLFLVVTATPSAWYDIVWDQAYATVPRYPYMLQLANAWPDGFQGGKQDACPSGTTRVANGGGCGPSGLASTVFVGPYALVTGTGVSGNARIEGHAQILGGKVTDATVGALTIVGSAFSVAGATTKAHTTFMPLDFFEGRSLSGGALVGDVELRASRSSGTCSGFVDGSTCTAPGTDRTPAPPYAWR